MLFCDSNWHGTSTVWFVIPYICISGVKSMVAEMAMAVTIKLYQQPLPKAPRTNRMVGSTYKARPQPIQVFTPMM